MFLFDYVGPTSHRVVTLGCLAVAVFYGLQVEGRSDAVIDKWWGPISMGFWVSYHCRL